MKTFIILSIPFMVSGYEQMTKLQASSYAVSQNLLNLLAHPLRDNLSHLYAPVLLFSTREPPTEDL